MTLDEMMLFAKIIAFTLGDRSVTISEIERDSAYNMLKKIVDQHWNWTEQQKSYCKQLINECELLMRK